MSCEKHCELKFVKITLKDLPIPQTGVAHRIGPPPKPGVFSFEWLVDYGVGSYPFTDQAVNNAIEKERDAELRRQEGPHVVQGCPDGCKCFANEPTPDDKAWIINTDPPPLVVITIVPGTPDRKYQVVWQTERKFAYVAGGCDEAGHPAAPSQPQPSHPGGE